MGSVFLLSRQSRSELIARRNKGALWPWIKDVDVYRCPRGRPGHGLTYTTVSSANGNAARGTYVFDGRYPYDFFPKTRPGLISERVGSTVLFLTSLTDIVSPGAGQRAVFIDEGQATRLSEDFHVEYLYPKWSEYNPPPIHHSDGVTLSMADGHAEYWKWKGRETVKMPRKLISTSRGTGNVYFERLEEDYEPQTEDGLYDLQRLQRATWGRLGYKP
ncbi:MAG: hypothetical protein ACYS0H_05755 [Planctomycetota bacterium]